MGKVDFTNLKQMRQAVLQLKNCHSDVHFWDAIVSNSDEILRTECLWMMQNCASYQDFSELYKFLGESPELIKNAELLFLYQAAAAERNYHQLGEAINKILLADYWQQYFKESVSDQGVEFALTALVEVKLDILINDLANAPANYEFLKKSGRDLIFAFPTIKALVSEKLRQDKREFVYYITSLKKIYVD